MGPSRRQRDIYCCCCRPGNLHHRWGKPGLDCKHHLGNPFSRDTSRLSILPSFPSFIPPPINWGVAIAGLSAKPLLLRLKSSRHQKQIRRLSLLSLPSFLTPEPPGSRAASPAIQPSPFTLSPRFAQEVLSRVRAAQPAGRAYIISTIGVSLAACGLHNNSPNTDYVEGAYRHIMDFVCEKCLSKCQRKKERKQEKLRAGVSQSCFLSGV
jgi:hypothetical protein